MLLTVLGLLQLFTMSASGRPTPSEDDDEESGDRLAAGGDGEGQDSSWESAGEEDLDFTAADIYDMIKDIRDPEKPNTLEELDVVFESGVRVRRLRDGSEGCWIRVHFTPTVPHCSLATLIGLCIRVKLDQSLPLKHKLDILITKGTHSTEEDVNKQINDKERIAAAMENPNLKELVERCVAERDT